MRFTKFLAEQKNTNMEHIEEMIFNDGVDGTRQAINFLRDIRNALAGNTARPINFTVKWDGAPAIFAGIDPSDGKFFVAKKGVFNKNPQVFKSDKDIDNDSKFPSDLKEPFKIALKELSKMGIRGVIQGDFMFGPGDLKTEEFEGESYLTFQPNTIVYAVPAGSKFAKELNSVKIGIVWHTTYTGRSLESMKSSFGKAIATKLRKNRSVWVDDANYKDQSGTATFTKRETTEITKILSKAGSTFNKVSASVMNHIADTELLRTRMKVYNNAQIRQGSQIGFKNAVPGLIDSLETFWSKEIDKVKTDGAKEKKTALKDEMINYVKENKSDIAKIYELMGLLTSAKQMIIDKLNKGSSLKTLLRTAYGFKVTNQEGYVAIDRLSNGAVKLVDRLEFSRANFSPDIIKGWEQ